MIDPIRNSPITITRNLVENELRLLEIVANCGLCMYSGTIFLGRCITVLNIIISVSHCITSLSNNPKLSFRAIARIELVRKSYSMPVPWMWILSIHIVYPLVPSRLRYRREKLFQCGLILTISTSLLYGIS